jgi:hypothetical protein
MTIYRLSLSEKIGGEHRGYQYFTAHEAMEKCKAEAKATDLIGETSVMVLATTKAGSSMHLTFTADTRTTDEK